MNLHHGRAPNMKQRVRFRVEREESFDEKNSHSLNETKNLRIKMKMLAIN